jgi:hypothetical protein
MIPQTPRVNHSIALKGSYKRLHKLIAAIYNFFKTKRKFCEFGGEITLGKFEMSVKNVLFPYIRFLGVYYNDLINKSRISIFKTMGLKEHEKLRRYHY